MMRSCYGRVATAVRATVGSMEAPSCNGKRPSLNSKPKETYIWFGHVGGL
jgi:hypothetical protein